MNSLENEAHPIFSQYKLVYGLTESLWLAYPGATFCIYFVLEIVLYFINSTGFSFSQCLLYKMSQYTICKLGSWSAGGVIGDKEFDKLHTFLHSLL